MAEPVSVKQLKDQLRLDPSFADEDGYLLDLIVAARRMAEKWTNRTIVGTAPSLPTEDMPIATRAILMLAAHWYDERDASAGPPQSVAALLAPLRHWGV
ncbi:head-tail connector protein [Sphingomonas sp. Leaf257]|jgi:hypothetical protein|uniref:head-tail connector protein n=1 Tax=Sphingomonas sp. Leaf257 TaxID=1736309 RepID=UPI0006F6A793|nr:head-tail connector protein [Sphingomonas sp. Leaf257]KQO52668.1 hypothetical protein ASF14_05025 [Sphingomonas sp. Leaf257]